MTPNPALLLLAATLSVLLASCATLPSPSRELDADLRRVIERERVISAQCVEDRRISGDVYAGAMEQKGSMEINAQFNRLSKEMDKATGGSRQRQRAILLTELRGNGCLFVLFQLNEYYHLLSTEEFAAAAKQSGKESSDLCP